MTGACKRCGSEVAHGDLRCPICSLPLVDAIEAQAGASILRCDECGAAMEYRAEVQAPKCAFCGSVAHLETTEDPIEKASWFVPFSVDARTAEAALKTWLSKRGFFRPSNLESKTTLSSMTPIWWAAWVCDASMHVSWAADTEVGSRRSSWAPHAGEFESKAANVLVGASRGLTSKEVHALAPYFDLSSAHQNAPSSAAQTVENFDVQRSAARQEIVSSLRRRAAQLATAKAPGNRIRNLGVEVLLRHLQSRSFGLPSYVLAYRYKSKLYRVVIHGQNAEVIVGKVPKSFVKLLMLLGGIVLATAIVVGLLHFFG